MKFRYLTRMEKIIVIFLMITFFISTLLIGIKFFKSVATPHASVGGVYSEGMIGSVQFLNPVFASFNPVDQDISSLIFSGLMRYNPAIDDLEDDMAVHTLDTTKTVYTFTLKDNVRWHDGEPVTADDILYTYQEVIQSPDFKNSLLRENFKGVTIKKINDTTVTFILAKPYKFFLTNLSVGILPKHILGQIPVANLDLSEFNTLSPIGSGPYKVLSIDSTNGSQRVSLARFDDFYGKKPFIQAVDFYVFPNEEQLQLQKNVLDGVQKLDKENKDIFTARGMFLVHGYTLPQYVAAFFNTKSEVLADKKTRMGLALGTDKDALLKSVDEKTKVGTPFLELGESHWLLQYDETKAQGALSDAGWKLPWKKDATSASTKKVREKDPEFITLPSNKTKYATTEKVFFVEGKVPAGTTAVYVNDYKLNKFTPEKTEFAYRASVELGTMKEGENLFKVEIEKEGSSKTFLDSITIFYTTDEAVKTQKLEEYAKEEEKNLLEITAEQNAEKEAEAKALAEEEAKKEKILDEKKEIVRVNDEGKSLELRIVAPEKPKNYGVIANELQKQWEKIGVKSNVEILSLEEIQKRFEKRDYDVLIFGQSLGYNYDSYPYWHSSQAEAGFNFSQLKKFEIDALLEEIRSTHKEDRRQNDLKQLEAKLIEEMPAVFLYTPENYFAISPRIKGASFSKMRNARDRFANVSEWYVDESYSLSDGTSLFTFFPWFFNTLKSDVETLIENNKTLQPEKQNSKVKGVVNE